MYYTPGSNMELKDSYIFGTFEIYLKYCSNEDTRKCFIDITIDWKNEGEKIGVGIIVWIILTKNEIYFFR